MRRMLEYIRAAIVVSATPAVLVFYAASSRTWVIALSVYLVLSTLVLLVLNHLLKENPGDDTKAPSARPPR
jgi:hypothetical protein